jgi:hypothetical protein
MHVCMSVCVPYMNMDMAFPLNAPYNQQSLLLGLMLEAEGLLARSMRSANDYCRSVRLGTDAVQAAETSTIHPLRVSL